ncbi:hypothetical protein FQN50_002336 [Emmonsiellopsis sp. PD_5]|nr:hypothetical protein FQN50_002336 [Emmonsiellopsis sp. PD_5]
MPSNIPIRVPTISTSSSPNLEDVLDPKELIQYVHTVVGHTIPKRDVEIIRKNLVTGRTLILYGTFEGLEELGLSWGIAHLLNDLKEEYLAKDQPARSEKLRPGEKRVRFQEPVVSDEWPAEQKRARTEATSMDTADTQDSAHISAARVRANKDKRHIRRQLKLDQEEAKAPNMFHIAARCKERRRQIIDLFDQTYNKNWDNAKIALSDPRKFTNLPIPFLGPEIPQWFMDGGNDKENFNYMGREVFSSLVDAFQSVVELPYYQDLWVYGLAGYGKSHLLAALVCYLTAREYRVIYLPDSRACVQGALTYFKMSLLFTWADLPDKVNEIISLRNRKQVHAFIRKNWSTSVIFVMDGMDALDDIDDTEIKAEIYSWLNMCRVGMKTVFSTSGNNKTFLKRADQQNNDYLFRVFGGYTRAEMDAWWVHHGTVDLGNFTREAIEDYTGCNPRLLANCTENGKVNLNCEEIHQVVRQCQRFIANMKGKLNEREWSMYTSYVKACMIGRAVDDTIAPEHVDHQFFTEKNQLGYCACGAVRDAVIKKLAQLGEILFSVQDSVEAMGWLINDPPAVGYFLKQAIIQSIIRNGIGYLDMTGPIQHYIFSGFPAYKLDKEVALYWPENFNFPPVDALLLRLNSADKRAELFVMQITIQQDHRDSEGNFFRSWASWRQCLYDYDITVTFVRITGQGKSEGKLVVESHEARGVGGKTVGLQYQSVNISVEDVNASVWRRYEGAKAEWELLN